MPQVSSGTFAFARPGKFRWSYDKPYEQLLVGDGDKLWIYDPDLNQVVGRGSSIARWARRRRRCSPGSNAVETEFRPDRRRRGRRH